ncbi:MAG: hypothetical protein Q9167_006068 [Letrouitia subvulpina]
MAPANQPPFSKDEKVLCFHGELLYDAKILDVVQKESKAWSFHVHYNGWKRTWDDWVDEERLRRLTEENKEMAKLMRQHALDVQQRAKNATANAKKKAVSSDLSSARGSEERHASATTTARGQKRARNMEIEEVGDYDSSLFNQISLWRSTMEPGAYPGTGSNIPEEATTRRYQTRAARLNVTGRPVKLKPTNVYSEVLSRPRKRVRLEENFVQVKNEVSDNIQGISEGVVQAVQPDCIELESRPPFTQSQIPQHEARISYEATPPSLLGQVKTQCRTSNGQSEDLCVLTNPRITPHLDQQLQKSESACSTVSGKEEKIDDELQKLPKLTQSVISTPKSFDIQEKPLGFLAMHSLEQKVDHELQKPSELGQSALSTRQSRNVQAKKSESPTVQTQAQGQGPKTDFDVQELSEIAQSVLSTPHSLDIQEELRESSTVQSQEQDIDVQLHKASEIAKSSLTTPNSQNTLEKLSELSAAQPFEQEVDHELQKLFQLPLPTLSLPPSPITQKEPSELSAAQYLEHQVAYELPKLPSPGKSALSLASESPDDQDKSWELPTEHSVEHRVALALLELSRQEYENPALYSSLEAPVGQKKPCGISTVQSTRHYANSQKPIIQAESRASTIPEEHSPKSDNGSSPLSSLPPDPPSTPCPTIPKFRALKRKLGNEFSPAAEDATSPSSKRKRKNDSPPRVKKKSPLVTKKPHPSIAKKPSPPVVEKPTSSSKRKREDDSSPIAEKRTSSSKRKRGNGSPPIAENITSSAQISLSLASSSNSLQHSSRHQASATPFSSEIAPAPKVLLSPVSLAKHDFPWLFEGKEDIKPAKRRRSAAQVVTNTTRTGPLTRAEKLADKDYAEILKTCKETAEEHPEFPHPVSLSAPEPTVLPEKHPKYWETSVKDPKNSARLDFFDELDPQQRPMTAGIPKDDPEFEAECARAQAFHSRPAVKIPMPDALKSLLVDDWEKVTKELSLVPLPAEMTVNAILDAYKKEEQEIRRAGSAEADILEEVVSGMKDYFDATLGRILLYRFEREQYLEARSDWEAGIGDFEGKSGPADVYGAEHLCRLLVKMPELIAQTNMDQGSVNRLREELTKLASWMSKRISDLFAIDYETTTHDYRERIRTSR